MSAFGGDRGGDRAQPAARVALGAAAARALSRLPARRPAGRRASAAAARALAAELLAEGAADPDDARRRALADPSPHPDLVWLRPRGTQHLVEDVRERVIGQVALPARSRPSAASS